MLFAAVALTGVLASVGMQTLTGPVTTITRVTQKNIADTQLLMNAKIIVNAAVSGTLGGDADSDGIIEPAPYVAAGGGETPPTNGGYLPTTLGLSLTDPWGSKYGYCVWDHGTTNTSTQRITGDNTASANTQPVIAIIASGPDKLFQTSCAAFTSGPIAVAKTGGSDDLIFKYTYAEASANANGLWTLNSTNQAKAELKDSGGTARVSIDRSTGVGDFLGVTTDSLVAKTNRIAVGGGLKLDTNTNVTACAAADAGVIRYNTTTLKLEICTGVVWKAAGSDLWLENGTHIYNGNTGNVGIGTNTPSQKLDVQGNTNISGNTVIGGTGSVVGNFTVNNDAFSVIAASKYVGIGKAVPTVALDVVGNAYVTGTGTIVDDLIVDTSSLFVDASANTVGIGTATPTYALDIYAVKTIGAIGSLDTNNAIVRIKEDTAGPSLFMDGNTIVSDGTFFVVGSTGSADVSVIANSAEVIRATAGGNVGIGISSPAVKLDVGGSARVTDGSSLQFGGTDTTITGNSSTDLLTISTAGAERMRVTATGSVGIGDTSPSARLSVAGGVKIANHTTCGAGENGTIRYESTLKVMQLCVDTNWKSVSSIDKLDDIGDVDAPSPAGNEVLAWDTVSSKWMAKPISALGPASVTPAGSDGSIQFKDGSNLGADPATFHWDKTNDRLGVGTNSPDTDLHIKRGAGNTVLKMESGSGYGTISHTGSNFDITNSATAGDLNVYTADELSFWTGTPSTRRLYIGSNGRTGIGTATPGALLDVEGGIQLGDDTGTCDAAKDGTLRYNTSQLQICVAGTWTNVGAGGGGGGLGETMVSGWPDAINCGGTGNPSMYYLTYAPFTDTKFYYRNIWHGSELSVIFKADKTYDSKTTSDAGCDSKGIGQLYGESRAYNFVGGGTAGAGTSIVTNVPDAIECGVSGTRRILFLQTTTATTYTYALSAGATAVGMQVVYNALPAGTHNSTTNTAGWTNANGCDGKTLAQLASETRTFDLVGGTGGGGSGLTVAGSDGYIQFNSSGALDGEPALFWDKPNNYLGVGLSGAPVATIDVAGGVKLGTDATCTAPKAGMLVYNAGSLQFCNSSGTFVPVATGTISLANGAAGRVQLSNGSGSFTSDANLVFSGGKLGVGGAPGSDTLNVTGTLGVSGNTTVGGTLAASNNATVGGTLGVTGNTTLGGTLGVTGAATLSSATVTGNLTVDTSTLVVDAAGNKVGIGVASPVVALDVAGGIRIGNETTCDGTRLGTLRFAADTLEVCKSAGWSPTGGGGSGTLWTVAGNDAYSTNTGNLGVGTTTPQAKLDVAGGIRLGDDTTACTANNNGTLRFNTGKMQICVNLAWTDLAVVSGTAPLPPSEEQPFTLVWPDAIVCATASETRYYFANANMNVATTRNYREVEGNNVVAFDTLGRFMTSGITGTNCHSKTMTQLINDGQTFNFKSGTETTMRPGYPDSIVCPRTGTPTTRFFMYITSATSSNIRYRDFNSAEYLDINPANNTAGSVIGSCYDSYYGGYYACGVSSFCDGDTVTQLYAGANGEKAYNLVGGDGTKSYDALLPDNIVCRDGNGDQYALYRSYTDASTIRYQNPNQSNSLYVDFNPSSRAPTGENLNGTPDCYKNLDVLRTENKAFNFADNGTTTGSGGGDNNPIITQPAPGSGNSLITGWPDLLVCNQTGGISIVLRYNRWRTDNLHGYFSSHTGYAAYFNDNGTWNTHASLGSTDCMNASMSQLIASGRTKNFRDAGAATSILPGWPDQILCTRNSDGVIFPVFIGLVDATTYRYYHQGGTSYSIIFNRNGTFSSDSLGTDCANKTIGQLMSEQSRTYNLHRGVDDGSVIPSVPDAIICTNTYGKKAIYWLDNFYQDNTANGLYYRSNSTNGIGFNTVKPYTFNSESTATDCAGKSIAQLHKEGATVFLADTNNIGSVPTPYTPAGGSKIDGWPDMILCQNNDNYPYLFHIAHQDATLTYYRTTAGTGLNFNKNQTFSSIGIGNTTCNSQSIAQLTALGATFNYGGGGGSGAGGGLPAGSDGQVQFRNNGAFAASSNFFWNNSLARLGIGTTSPAVKLEVVGGIKIGNESATCAPGVAGTLRWNGTALQICDGAAWSAVGSGGSGTPGGTSGQLQFNSAGTFGGTNNMVWDNANTRLGINTATPTANLHIINSTTNNAVVIDETPSGAGESHIALRNATGSTFLTLAGASAVSSFNSLTQAGDSRIIFSNAGVSESGGLVIAPWSASAKGIRIDGSSGNVGIGTATPVATLDVAGGVRVGNSLICAAGGANNGTLRFDPATKNMQICV
ncbi:MAG: hypothetical protein EBQ96_03615, partial [Proteobacteria bacterium]|nr:hypothetical protein [Pseudomonadota bacterium]